MKLYGQHVMNSISKTCIPIQINSDAHLPREITYQFAETVAQLLTIGIQKAKIFYKNERIYATLDKKGLTMS